MTVKLCALGYSFVLPNVVCFENVQHCLMSQGWIPLKSLLSFSSAISAYTASNACNKKEFGSFGWNLFRSLAVHNFAIKEFSHSLKTFEFSTKLFETVHMWSVLYAFGGTLVILYIFVPQSKYVIEILLNG